MDYIILGIVAIICMLFAYCYYIKLTINKLPDGALELIISEVIEVGGVLRRSLEDGKLTDEEMKELIKSCKNSLDEIVDFLNKNKGE